jgi:Rrf2 family protein
VKPSSRFVVASHVLTLLAMFSERELTSEQIAGSVNTSPVVIRRLLGQLRTAGLVRAQAGKSGGYALARPPADIRLDAVYRAVEQQPLFRGHPQPPNRKCPVGANILGSLEPVLAPAEQALIDALGRSTVADLLESVRARASKPR